jgi:hypothetical protein
MAKNTAQEADLRRFRYAALYAVAGAEFRIEQRVWLKNSLEG